MKRSRAEVMYATGPLLFPAAGSISRWSMVHSRAQGLNVRAQMLFFYSSVSACIASADLKVYAHQQGFDLPVENIKKAGGRVSAGS